MKTPPLVTARAVLRTGAGIGSVAARELDRRDGPPWAHAICRVAASQPGRRVHMKAAVGRCTRVG